MIRIGQYELLIPLGSGGSANVYLARDTSANVDGRLVALKVLLKELTRRRDSLAMFLSEARIAARLEHPNAVKIYGLGRAENVYCIAQEYVFGENLAQVLVDSGKNNRPLTVGAILKVVAQVAGALDAAHRLRSSDGAHLNLVHRDISGQNVMLSFGGVPKLMDFGIAKAMDRGFETQVGIVKGKFPYMSPEQTLGKKLDHRSDIFSLGILLWEALTGEALFNGHSPGTIMKSIREKRIIPPSKIAPELSPILDPIVMRALRRAPDHRYQHASELEALIDDVIDNAGLKIDQTTIAEELEEIYGDLIARKMKSLAKVITGDIDLAEIEQLFGGRSLKDCPELQLDSNIEELDMLTLNPESSRRRTSRPRLATIAARVTPDMSRRFQEVLESSESKPAGAGPSLSIDEEKLVLESLEQEAPSSPDLFAEELLENWNSTEFEMPLVPITNAEELHAEAPTRAQDLMEAPSVRSNRAIPVAKETDIVRESETKDYKVETRPKDELKEKVGDVLIPPSRLNKHGDPGRPLTPATLLDKDVPSTEDFERYAMAKSAEAKPTKVLSAQDEKPRESIYFVLFCIGLFVVGVLVSVLIAG